MKLTLNVPALERLLGGDTELEVELRQQVAAAFAEKHIELHKKQLKDTVTSEAYTKTLAALREILAEAIKTEVGVLVRTDNWSSALRPELLAPIKALIEQTTRQAVDSALKTAIDDKINYYEGSWRTHIDKKVKEALDKNIEAQIQAEVQRRLQVAAGLPVTEKPA